MALGMARDICVNVLSLLHSQIPAMLLDLSPFLDFFSFKLNSFKEQSNALYPALCQYLDFHNSFMSPLNEGMVMTGSQPLEQRD